MTDAIDEDFVAYRLKEAAQTYLSLPPSLRPAVGIVGFHASPIDLAERGIRVVSPDGARIERMREALDWLDLIPRDAYALRQLVFVRALSNPATGRELFSWRQIAGTLGQDARVVRGWHKSAITIIVRLLRLRAAVADRRAA